MKRSVLGLFVAALLLAAIGWSISSQMEELEPPAGYVRSDLQLISQESKESWSAKWTGPIQAATMMAWFHEHGYSRLMRDFNGDGVIDELDTIELADVFGRGVMQADGPRGTNDARLVIGLAQYVANLYPNEFVLKIYDLGFPAEFNAEGSTSFAPDAIPGIELALINDPYLYAYEYELETAEGVIVGLEERENENTYLSGRSYMFEQTPDGYTPVDLAWAEENRLLPGRQGRVLETVAKEEDRLYFDFRFGWTPVEFMLALSPVEVPEFSSEDYVCPEDAIGYHVDTYTLDYGTIEIEECVTREGDFDTYTWTVTNISYVWNGCGLCYFGVASSGYSSVGHSGPGPWMFSEWPVFWAWEAPLGSCGIQPGQKGVFSVTVPGPTIDTYVSAGIGACSPPPPPPDGIVLELDGGVLDGLGERTPFYKVRTTGPGRCPDLTVLIRDNSCSYDVETGMWDITVWVRVTNIGAAPVTTPFGVIVESDSYPASTTWGPMLPIAPSGGFVDGVLEYSISSPTPPCPEDFTVTVDFTDEIAECSEDNNTSPGSECCEGGPGDRVGACCLPDGSCVDASEPDCMAMGGDFQGPGTSCATTECPTTSGECPDLVVEFLERLTYCLQDGATAPVWKIYTTVRATNIGTATANAGMIKVKVESPWGDQSDYVGPLDPGEYEDVSFQWTLGPNSPPQCNAELTAEVDAFPRKIDECCDGCEDNNEASVIINCPGCIR